MSDVVLKLTDLNAHYGHIHALRGISLEVKAGQIVTLLGANGAGKSTTMKCISGLLKPTGGKIEFMGENIFGQSAHDIVKRGLIHVPEGRRIFKGMTIQENLELGSFTLKDDAERNQRMDHVYELFPVLGERRHRDAGFLSVLGRSDTHEPHIAQVYSFPEQAASRSGTIFGRSTIRRRIRGRKT